MAGVAGGASVAVFSVAGGAAGVAVALAAAAVVLADAGVTVIAAVAGASVTAAAIVVVTMVQLPSWVTWLPMGHGKAQITS